MRSAISEVERLRFSIDPMLMFIEIRYAPLLRMEAKAFWESAWPKL